jgi:hypothetical protein
MTNQFDSNLAGHSVLVKAIARSETVVTFSTSNQGRELTPSLTVMGLGVPNVLLDWTSSDERVTFNNGKFVLSNTVAVGQSVTTTLTAKDDRFGFTLYTSPSPQPLQYIASTVSNLSGLTLSSGTLNPVFETNTLIYTVSVPNATSSITVTPTVADSTTTVKVNGTTVASGSASTSINLNVGVNTITVVSTAQDGATTKTYTITVTREQAPPPPAPEPPAPPPAPVTPPTPPAPVTPPTPPTPPPPPPAPPTVVVDKEITQVTQSTVNSINNVKNQLTQASTEQKAEIIEQALQTATTNLQKISEVQIQQSSIVVNQNRATVQVKTDDLISAIKTIGQQTTQLNNALKELSPDAKVTPQLTLSLGNVQAQTVSVPLPKQVLDTAKENGIQKVEVEVRGVGIQFNPAQFTANTTVEISTVPEATIQQRAGGTVLAEPINFSFTGDNGQRITQFDTPVQLVLKLKPDVNVDTRYLTAAKITDNGIQIVGGSLFGGEWRVNRINLSTYTIITNRVRFGDTSSVSSWAGTQINVVAAKGVIEGRGEGVYDPNANVTRAEFAKMISKALGIDGGIAQENFSDVNASDWFQPYVATVSKWGITNGRSADKFEPNANITRAEMATMIARAMQKVNGTVSLVPAETALAKFKDNNQVIPSLRAGVAFASDQAIVIGTPGDNFNPNGYATRAEAAVMIYRVVSR